MSFGKRLREERARLGLSLFKMAHLAHVGKRAQLDREKDERSLDAVYLGRIALVGFDVAYVITGRRADALSSQADLSGREQALLLRYQSLSKEGKEIVTAAARFAADRSALARASNDEQMPPEVNAQTS